MNRSGLIIRLFLILTAITLPGSIAASAQNTPVGTFIGSLFESDAGKPAPARVYAIGKSDSLFMAEECIPYDRSEFAARIGYSGRHFTTRGNTFTLKLPEGRYTIVIERGKEFLPIRESITVVSGKTEHRKFPLRRWIDMAARGWYSGDLHCHRPLGDLAGLLLAEDLNVVVPQTVWSSAVSPDLETWLGKADAEGVVRVDSTHLFSVLGHEVERMQNSALLLHHTGKTVLPVAEYVRLGAPDPVPLDAVHAAGGFAEMEKPWWPDAHVDMALGGVDFLGLAHNHFTYRSYLPEHDRLRTEFRNDYPEDVRGYAQYVFDLYYAYLNCGFRPMLSAGSASGVLPNPVGYNRIYAKCEGGFSYDSFFKALKAGHTFVTNGPLLIMTAGGKPMGETLSLTDKGGNTVRVACELHSIQPIDRLEIVQDGKIVRTFAPKLIGNTHTARITAEIPVSETGWIAARCFEKREDTVRFAHTSPVFVSVDGAPFFPKRYAAEYFLRKTKELITAAETTAYPNAEAKAATLEYYRKALGVYEDLAGKSR
jgi:hypothetical protein